MIFLKIIAIINIILLSNLYLIKYFNLKNFKKYVKNYFNSIIDLKNIITRKNKFNQNKILEKKLNKVSLNGIFLLSSLLKIIFPYILVFYSIILFELNISIIITSIFALFPYILLFKK